MFCLDFECIRKQNFLLGWQSSSLFCRVHISKSRSRIVGVTILRGGMLPLHTLKRETKDIEASALKSSWGPGSCLQKRSVGKNNAFVNWLIRIYCGLVAATTTLQNFAYALILEPSFLSTTTYLVLFSSTHDLTKTYIFHLCVCLLIFTLK